MEANGINGGRMDVRTTVYALSSSSWPRFFRYIGMTCRPECRLKMHSLASTRVGSWIFWERVSGEQVYLSEIDVAYRRVDGARIEKKWINALASPFLLNDTPWRANQSKQGVPKGVYVAFDRAMHSSRLAVQCERHEEAANLMSIARMLAGSFKTLGLSALCKEARAECNRQSHIMSDVRPCVVASLDEIDCNYEGPLPVGMRYLRHEDDEDN